jgi:hypothetical protein
MKYLNSNCSLSSNIGNSDTIIFEVKTKKSFFRMIYICKFGFSEQIPQWSDNKGYSKLLIVKVDKQLITKYIIAPFL